MRNLNYLTRHNLWTDIVYSIAYADRDYLYKQGRNFETKENHLWAIVTEHLMEKLQRKVAK